MESPAHDPLRIVMVTDVPFWLESKGSERRVSALLRGLGERSASLAVARPRPMREEDARALGERFPRLWVYGPNLTTGPRGRLAALEPTHCGSAGLAPPAFVDAVIAAERPNAVLVEYVRLTHYVEHGDPNLWSRVARVLDTHDVMHRRAEVCRARGSSHFLDITREQEARALDRYDLVLAIQNDERVELEALTDRPVRTVHHAHEARAIEPREPDGVLRLAFASAEDDSALISLGRFLADVWPGVREACDGAVELRLYGRLCARFGPEVASVPGVVVRGFVDDATDAHRECDAVLNIVEFGSGLKIKSVEALCHGRALVTTPEGATGLPRERATDACGLSAAWARGGAESPDARGTEAAYVVCRSPEQWARALGILAREPEARDALAMNGLALAERMFSARAALAPLVEALRESVRGRGIGGPAANDAGRCAAIDRAHAVRAAIRGGFVGPVNGVSRPLPTVFSLSDLLDRGAVSMHGDGRRIGTRAVTLAGRTRRAIVMPPPSAAEFALEAGPLLLTFAVGMLEECWDEPGGGPARFVILADDAPVFSWDMNPRASAGDRRWHGHRVYLPAASKEAEGAAGDRLGGRSRRVRLATFGVGGDACRWTAWAEPTAIVLTDAVAEELAWHAPRELAPPGLVRREDARVSAVLRRALARVTRGGQHAP